MRKIILSALAAVTLLSSCTTSTNGGGGTGYVYLMTSYETRTVNQTPREVELLYSDKLTGELTEANLKYTFKDMPVLRVQKIKGDSLSSIEYSYTSTNVLTMKSTVNGKQAVDSMKLDQNYMAYQYYKDGKLEEMPLKYNDNGFRTKVYNVDMLVDSYMYIAASVAGTDIAKYTYSNISNVMQLQQENIDGIPYAWMSERFGKQSKFLLSSVVCVEDGKEVKYEYKYELDNNKCVTKEVITRDSQEFMTNTYKYVMGIVNIE